MSTKTRVRLSGAVALSLIFVLSDLVHASAESGTVTLPKVLQQKSNAATQDVNAPTRKQKQLIDQNKKLQNTRKGLETYKGSYPTQGEIQRAKSQQDGIVPQCVGPSCKLLRTKIGQ